MDQSSVRSVNRFYTRDRTGKRKCEDTVLSYRGTGWFFAAGAAVWDCALLCRGVCLRHSLGPQSMNSRRRNVYSS